MEPKVEFLPCGPTVYGLVHIGSRAGLGFLILRSVLSEGWMRSPCPNYTDVDDKIIARPRKGSRPKPWPINTLWKSKDLRSQACRSRHKTTVTTHMPEMTQIFMIIANGKAYAVDGDVYFR